MLVLSRKIGESIVINGELEIKIVEISGDKIRVGVEAPQSYKILRKELLQTMESNQAAAHFPVNMKVLLGLASRIKNQQTAAKAADSADKK